MQDFSSGLPSDTKTQVGGLANNVAGVLCYFPCTALIASILWLATEPKSNRFVRFHAMQSLILGVAMAVLFVVLWIVFFVLTYILGHLSGLLAGIVGLVSVLVFLALAAGYVGALIFGMMKAYQGQLLKLPVVGQLAEQYSS
jgi:uncharacterized membrane protein